MCTVIESLINEMWVNRISVKGGFHYEVYVNDASTRVTRMGTIYLYNIGWHPLYSPFVSSDDDAILQKHCFLFSTKINGICAPCHRLPDDPSGQNQMRLEGSVCDLCIQRSAYQAGRGGQRMVPHRLSEDFASSSCSPSSSLGSSSK